jgi:hypothetical protein
VRRLHPRKAIFRCAGPVPRQLFIDLRLGRPQGAALLSFPPMGLNAPPSAETRTYVLAVWNLPFCLDRAAVDDPDGVGERIQDIQRLLRIRLMFNRTSLAAH